MNRMPKRGGKGRISNNLVAASCAAVLTVYAAGYWRTRDAARQFDTQSKGRKPAARVHRTVAIASTPALIEPSSPASVSGSQPHPTIASAATTAPVRTAQASGPRTRHAAATVRNEAPTAPAAGSSSTVAGPDSTPTPAPAAGGIVVHSIPMPAEPTAAPLPESGPAATPAAAWRDGTYRGYGDSPHGGVNVQVVIKNGRIIEATIEACNTRYPCELIDRLLHQTVLIQSSEVDYVSRATESSQAYAEGLAEALNTALAQPAGKDAAAQ